MLTPKKKILFTGGGTVGHVAPNLALIARFQQGGYDVCYLGSYSGVERDLVSRMAISYYPVATGKLRRYFSWQNFFDPFMVLYGVIQSLLLLWRLKPDIVFSKGGFVALPVVIAAWALRIPIVVHEADLTPGLANRLSFPLVTRICITFPETMDALVEKYRTKTIVSGLPIRAAFLQPDPEYGRKLCGFSSDKKIIVVFGGSLGASRINSVVRTILPSLLKQFQIAHICGRGMVDESLECNGYRQFAYLHEEFPHLLAAADLVISRAGANTIYELLALRKPSILLPLSSAISRGDQIINAKYCLTHGFSEVIFDDQLGSDILLAKMSNLINNYKETLNKLTQFKLLNAEAIIYAMVDNLLAA